MSTSVMFCQGSNVRIGQRAVNQNKFVKDGGQLEPEASRAVLADVENGEAIKGVVDQRVGDRHAVNNAEVVDDLDLSGLSVDDHGETSSKHESEKSP